MRIGLIAPPWLPVPPPGYGGTEAVIAELCKGLRAAGHQPVLAAHPASTAAAELVRVEAEPAVGFGSLEDEVTFSRAARRALSSAGVDIVHDHTAGGALAPQPGPPTVTTMHGPPDDRLGGLYRRAAGHGSIVAISACQAEAARRAGVAVGAVIHHGIDPSELPLGDGAGGYLLHLGRMSPDKGIDVAIAVARRAGMELRIASKAREPAERAYLEEVIRPLLGPGIEYLGEVCGAERAVLLADALALVNPIQWDEPFGMVMIEALACGTPVLATPRGSAPEIVDETVGRLASDLDGLVAATAELKSIDREVCRQRVLERFSTERMVRDHLSHYCSLTDGDVPAACNAFAGTASG